MRTAPPLKDDVCILRSPEHCGWCQESEANAASLGATLPCSHGGPWRAADGTFPIVVRRKGCGTCAPMRFG